MPAKDKPAPVEVVNVKPLIVEIAEAEPFHPVLNPDGKVPPVLVKKEDNVTLSPTTTAQEDIVTAGQRHINILWESVQGIISITITASVVYCQINNIQSETLNNAFFFVVATYLQRTNHVRIGGVGQKANEVYRGR